MVPPVDANNKNRSSGTTPAASTNNQAVGNKKKRVRGQHQRKNNNNNSNNNHNHKNGHNNNGGGRARPSGKQQQPMNENRLSRSLSWALRHAAPNIGLTIREDGYVPVQEILDSAHPKLRGATLEGIQRVVETSDKKRFKMEERPMDLYYPKNNNSSSSNHQKAKNPLAMPSGSDDDDKNPSTEQEKKKTMILCIRANQGHSIAKIDPNLLLTKLTPGELRSLPCIVHGTYTEAWESISSKQQGTNSNGGGGGGGLKKMNRTHIHFASGLPADNEVISGMRKNCTVRIFIDASKCAADDRIDFYRSDNGVILSDGVGDTGVLPVRYFSHATDSTGRTLLDNRNTEAK